jgi:anti-sigma regulatory factor (Ser/Thr protein kinase)
MTFDADPGDADVFETVLENRLAEIARVIDEFDEFAAEHGLQNPVRRRVDMALDEVLNNIISYGFEDAEEAQTIMVRGEVSPEQVTITVIDSGRPFDPFAQELSVTESGVEDREIGGLGIHLVRNVMDSVSYRRFEDKNEVILVKQRSAVAT